jgi:hypothetical protein
MFTYSILYDSDGDADTNRCVDWRPLEFTLSLVGQCDSSK